MGGSAPARCSAPEPAQDIADYVHNLTTRLAKAKRMFVRIKFVRKAIISLALVDTGNLSQTLISDNLAKLLGLKVTPVAVNLRAPDTQTIRVEGEANISFFMEGVKREFQCKAYVIKDLAFPINLGFSFLDYARAHIDFQTKVLAFGRGEGVVGLLERNTHLDAPSLDIRFSTVIQDANNLNLDASNYMLYIPTRACASVEKRRPLQIGARAPVLKPEMLHQVSGEVPLPAPLPHFRFPSELGTSEGAYTRGEGGDVGQ